MTRPRPLVLGLALNLAILLGAAGSGCKSSSSGTEATKSDTKAADGKRGAAKFGHKLLYKNVTTKLKSCIGVQPSIQFLKGGELRLQYIHGCGQEARDEVAETMWVMAEKVAELAPADKTPPLRIQAVTDTGNATRFFTGVFTSAELAAVRGGSLELAAWRETIREGIDNLGTVEAEATYVAGLRKPKRNNPPKVANFPSIAQGFVEFLPCVAGATVEMSSPISVTFTEGCEHKTRDNAEVTMFRVSMEMIGQLRRYKAFGDVKFASTVAGDQQYEHLASAQVLDGIRRRKYGVVDWISANRQ